MVRQLWWKFAVPVLVVMSLAAYVAAPLVDRLLTSWFRTDVELRARLVFNSMEFALLSLTQDTNQANLARYLERITSDERLQAIMICDAGKLLQKTPGTPPTLQCDDGGPVAKDQNLVLDGKSLQVSRFVAAAGSARPLSVTIVHDLSFIGGRKVTARDFLVALVVLFGAVVVLLGIGIAWLVLRSWVQSLLGNIRNRSVASAPAVASRAQGDVLAQVSAILTELEKAQRLEIDYRENWTPDALRHLVREQLGSPEVVVVSNREPYMHSREADDSISVNYPASGMVTAIEPVIRACAGRWFAHGSGDADRAVVDKNNELQVPPDDPSYTLQRIWLDEAEENGYYYGYSNEGLWPLCHLAHVRPEFRDGDWAQYVAVNRKFADAVARSSRSLNPVVLIQDYHLALLPKFIRERLPGATIAIFWHIPWPSAESFGICPQRRVLLEAMLAADIVGFHTRHHCQNFLATVDRFAETNIDHERQRIRFDGHTCQVASYPISIEWPPVRLADVAPVADCRARVMDRLGIGRNAFIGVGVERWDFTKGVLERFEAIEFLLDREPGLIGKLAFIQIAAPTRSRLPAYARLQEETRAAAQRINARFSRGGWQPIILLDRHHAPHEVFEYLRACDFCVVNSLHDGMNLVAKEFVAARDDERGVLILSAFAGASRELVEALIVNPYDIPATAEAIRQAWHMGEPEQHERMRLMRRTVKENNVYRWAGHLLNDVARVRQRQRIAEMRAAAKPKFASFMDHL